MRQSNLDARMQLSAIDADLERFERQSVRIATSASLLVLALAGYSLLAATPL